MKKKIFYIAIAMFVGIFACQEIIPNIPIEPEAYEVVRVVDGDTIVVEIDGDEEKVRLIGIDTPESVSPNKKKNCIEGKVASEYVKNRLEGERVQLEYDVGKRDRYGRILAYVWIDQEMLNKTLLEIGYAKTMSIPPNEKYANYFIEIQNNAIADSMGFWQVANH